MQILLSYVNKIEKEKKSSIQYSNNFHKVEKSIDKVNKKRVWNNNDPIIY